MPRAKEIAERALAQWPANASVLIAAYGVATSQKDTFAKIAVSSDSEIEPDNAMLRRR